MDCFVINIEIILNDMMIFYDLANVFVSFIFIVIKMDFSYFPIFKDIIYDIFT